MRSWVPGLLFLLVFFVLHGLAAESDRATMEGYRNCAYAAPLEVAGE